MDIYEIFRNLHYHHENEVVELLWNKLPLDYTEEQKLSKIKNLLYKMHKSDEIWLDEDRMWHRKES